MTNYELPKMKYNEQKGLVSVIVPIYNCEAYLNECLDSILLQTFTNWEAILVNDGSTDNTGKILDEYAKKDSRFLVIHKQNQGTLLARKTGFENSRGEFIASIDSDDICNSQFLEKMNSKIIEMDADFVWCKCNEPNIYNITDYNWDLDVSKNIAIVTNTREGIACYTWNKLIRRDIYSRVYFPNVHLTLGEDPVQILQVAYYSKSASFIPEILYFHRYGGVTANENFVPIIQSKISIYETMEFLFNGIIPKNLENTFYIRYSNISYYFFLLSKNERQIFKDKLEPLLSGFIRYEKKLHLKICLFLANKGIEFPFTLLKWIKFKKIDKLKKLCKIYGPIYIYGVGFWSERAVYFFEKEQIEIKGFIVSDGFKKLDKFKGKNIYEISQIKPNNKQIVVLALDDKNKKQVIPNLKKAKILYLEFISVF